MTIQKGLTYLYRVFGSSLAQTTTAKELQQHLLLPRNMGNIIAKLFTPTPNADCSGPASSRAQESPQEEGTYGETRREESPREENLEERPAEEDAVEELQGAEDTEEEIPAEESLGEEKTGEPGRREPGRREHVRRERVIMRLRGGGGNSSDHEPDPESIPLGRDRLSTELPTAGQEQRATSVKTAHSHPHGTQNTTEASSIPSSKRKRPEDDESGPLPKLARSHSPAFESSSSDGHPTPTSDHESYYPSMPASEPDLKRKRSQEDAGHGAHAKRAHTSSPAHSLRTDESNQGALPPTHKRKRAPHDNEHGASSKAARTHSPTHSDADHSDKDASSSVHKRKRAPDDDEHGASSKAARTYSPTHSSDADCSDEGATSTLRKRKRSLDDEEHGALPKASRTYSPVNSSDFSDAYMSSKTTKRKLSEESGEEATPASKRARTHSKSPSSSPRATGNAEGLDRFDILPSNKRKRTSRFDILPEVDGEEALPPAKRSRPTRFDILPDGTTQAPSTKRKRGPLPWVNPEYPYHTKRR